VTVLIREQKPQPPTKVALADSDGDGVPDIEDLCPDVPGPPENHGCPLTGDRDGDGVPDDIDRCPDLPGPKENFGCPWPDRDHDGVPDKDDRCPDVAGPPENFGCPWPDRDHDGVPDKDDKCPDEPGPKENFGCPRKQTLIVVRKDRIELKQQVRFAQNRSQILSSSNRMLRQVARAMKDAPGIYVRIEGHTDNVGGLDHNMQLSQERAEAVKAFLVRQGIQPVRLTAEGYGPTRPLGPNTTRAGRAANRRVEFRMMEPPAPATPAPAK
jgi:outer membrane protein OmpA-like peptidoglycan-associated protein